MQRGIRITDDLYTYEDPGLQEGDTIMVGEIQMEVHDTLNAVNRDTVWRTTLERKQHNG